MAASDRPIWFVGDRADPAAAAIALRLPGDRTRVLAARGSLPRFRLGAEVTRPSLVVVHRATLGQPDRERLSRLRDWLGEEGRIVLCVGPQARAAEVERWLGVADAVVPDVVAATTIGRHVAVADRASLTPIATSEASASPLDVTVVSTNPALRATLAALLRANRCVVVERADLEGSGTPSALPESGADVTVWDVPVLEAGWVDRLRRASGAGVGPLVALIGFLDARDARAASEAGATITLDLPVDAADLVAAVHQAARSRRDPAHPVPPAPRRASRPRIADPPAVD